MCRHALFSLLMVAFAGAATARPLIITYDPPPPLALFEMVLSSPAANSQINGTPPAVSVTYSQNVLTEKSSIKLYDQYNNPVNTVPVVTQGATNVLKAEIPGKLFTGTYRIDAVAQCLCAAATVITNSIQFDIY